MGDNGYILSVENAISSYVPNAFPFISLNVGAIQHGQTRRRSHRQQILRGD